MIIGKHSLIFRHSFREKLITLILRLAGPLTTTCYIVVSKSEMAFDEHASCRDSRSDLAVVSIRGLTVHPGSVAGDRAAPQPTYRPGGRTGRPVGADQTVLGQLVKVALRRWAWV
jgi:hypothetical protein